MANKKINELDVRIPTINDLMLIGDSVTGFSYQITVQDLSDFISSGGVTGSGTANMIPRWDGSNSLTDSSIYEDATMLYTNSQSSGLYFDYGVKVFRIGSFDVTLDSYLELSRLSPYTAYASFNANGSPQGMWMNLVGWQGKFGFGPSLTSWIGFGVNGSSGKVSIGDIDATFANTILYVESYSRKIATSDFFVDKGLLLDFAYQDYRLGDYNSNTNYGYFRVYQPDYKVSMVRNNPMGAGEISIVLDGMAQTISLNGIASATTSNVLYYNSSTGAVTYGTATGGVTGSGTTNQLAKWNSSTDLTASNIADDGSNMAFYTSISALYKYNFFSVDVVTNFNLGNSGKIRIGSGSGQKNGFVQSAYGNFIFGSNTYYTAPNWRYDANGYGAFIQMETQTAGVINFLTAPLNSGGSGATMTPVGRMQILNNGNILVNKSIDGGYRFDIGGSFRITGATSNTASTLVRIENSSAQIGLSILDNGYIGVNTSSPNALTEIVSKAVLSSNIRLTGVSTDNGYGGFIELVSNNLTSINYQIYTTASGVILSTTDTQSVINYGYSFVAGVGATISGKILSASTGFYVRGNTGFDLNLGSDNTNNRLIIKSTTGNILVNTTTDSTFKLDLVATGSANGIRVTGGGTTSATAGLRVNTSGGTTNLIVLDNGNIGVREANPTARIHIATGGGTTSSIGLKVRNSGDTHDILKTYGTSQTHLSDASGLPSIETSAILQIDSITKGLLLPRMTDTQILAISSPANGLMVYSTSQNVLCFYDGSGWHKFTHTNL